MLSSHDGTAAERRAIEEMRKRAADEDEEQRGFADVFDRLRQAAAAAAGRGGRIDISTFARVLDEARLFVGQAELRRRLHARAEKARTNPNSRSLAPASVCAKCVRSSAFSSS